MNCPIYGTNNSIDSIKAAGIIVYTNKRGFRKKCLRLDMIRRNRVDGRCEMFVVAVVVLYRSFFGAFTAADRADGYAGTLYGHSVRGYQRV